MCLKCRRIGELKGGFRRLSFNQQIISPPLNLLEIHLISSLQPLSKSPLFSLGYALGIPFPTASPKTPHKRLWSKLCDNCRGLKASTSIKVVQYLFCFRDRSAPIVILCFGIIFAYHQSAEDTEVTNHMASSYDSLTHKLFCSIRIIIDILFECISLRKILCRIQQGHFIIRGDGSRCAPYHRNS